VLLLDHLVRASKQRWRRVEADPLAVLADYELEFGWLLDG